MLIKKDELLSAIRVVDLVQARVGIPSSEFIKVDPVKGGVSFALASETLGLSQCKTDEAWMLKGSFFIDRRVLLPFLNQESKVAVVKASMPGKALVLQYGRRKLTLTAITDVTGYGDGKTPKADVQMHLTDVQKELAAVAAKYAPQDQSLPQLQCVYLGKDGTVVASNATTVFCGKAPKGAGHTIMFPVYLLAAVNTADLKSISVGKTFSTLVFANGTVTQSLPAKTAKHFPINDLMALVGKARKRPTVFSVAAGTLSSALSQFISVVAANKDKVLKLHGTVGDKRVNVSGGVSHASFADSFKVLGRVNSTFECELPVDALLPFVDLAAKEHTQIIHATFDQTSPYYFTTAAACLIISRKAN